MFRYLLLLLLLLLCDAILTGDYSTVANSWWITVTMLSFLYYALFCCNINILHYRMYIFGAELSALLFKHSVVSWLFPFHWFEKRAPKQEEKCRTIASTVGVMRLFMSLAYNPQQSCVLCCAVLLSQHSHVHGGSHKLRVRMVVCVPACQCASVCVRVYFACNPYRLQFFIQNNSFTIPHCWAGKVQQVDNRWRGFHLPRAASQISYWPLHSIHIRVYAMK